MQPLCISFFRIPAWIGKVTICANESVVIITGKNLLHQTTIEYAYRELSEHYVKAKQGDTDWFSAGSAAVVVGLTLSLASRVFPGLQQYLWIKILEAAADVNLPANRVIEYFNTAMSFPINMAQQQLKDSKGVIKSTQKSVADKKSKSEEEDKESKSMEENKNTGGIDLDPRTIPFKTAIGRKVEAFLPSSYRNLDFKFLQGLYFRITDIKLIGNNAAELL